ncbi:hypothetical protein BDW62DRAFT_207193 [Aspergillus aurantiobrunneus]
MTDTKLFQPLKIGQLQLEHRIAMPSHTPGTLLITENTGVSDAHVDYPHNTGIYTRDQISAWKEVTDAVHAKGCYIFLQLNGAGRTADRGFPKLAPSAVPLSQQESAIPIED